MVFCNFKVPILLLLLSSVTHYWLCLLVVLAGIPTGNRWHNQRGARSRDGGVAWAGNPGKTFPLLVLRLGASRGGIQPLLVCCRSGGWVRGTDAPISPSSHPASASHSLNIGDVAHERPACWTQGGWRREWICWGMEGRVQEPCPDHLPCFLFAILFVRGLFWDFPGSAVPKTSPPKAGGAGSIPVQVAKIPHVLQPKYQKTETILSQIQ